MLCTETHALTSLLYAVVESERRFKAPCLTQRESRSGVASESRKVKRVTFSEAAPMIGAWIEACFPGGSPASKAGIEELIAEAVEAARNDFGVDEPISGQRGTHSPPSL